VPQTPSPVQVIKRRVPPSPGPNVDSVTPSVIDLTLESGLEDDVPFAKPHLANTEASHARHHSSRRDQAMACPFIEHQAVEEGVDGVSQSGSCNSQDDSDLSKLSCVTDGTRTKQYCNCTIVAITS